jgi:antitoxin component YwqK of YwqJK toxin-antitoxin module
LYYEDGNIKFAGEFENGHPAPGKPGIQYFENGNKKYEGGLVGGLWHG